MMHRSVFACEIQFVWARSTSAIETAWTLAREAVCGCLNAPKWRCEVHSPCFRIVQSLLRNHANGPKATNQCSGPGLSRVV